MYMYILRLYPPRASMNGSRMHTCILHPRPGCMLPECTRTITKPVSSQSAFRHSAINSPLSFPIIFLRGISPHGAIIVVCSSKSSTELSCEGRRRGRGRIAEPSFRSREFIVVFLVEFVSGFVEIRSRFVIVAVVAVQKRKQDGEGCNGSS